MGRRVGATTGSGAFMAVVLAGRQDMPRVGAAVTFRLETILWCSPRRPVGAPAVPSGALRSCCAATNNRHNAGLSPPRPAGDSEPRDTGVATLPMNQTQPRQFVIQGITTAGRTFRPSDWSERLAGAMSSFRPGGGAGGIGAHIGYSPYCLPQVVDGVKCVWVNEALKDIEPMAWEFVMNFARDNQLPVNEVCELPQPSAR